MAQRVVKLLQAEGAVSMNGLWIMIALMIVGGWATKTADCYIGIQRACEAVAKQYEPSKSAPPGGWGDWRDWLESKPKTEKEPTP
jgi:hypothetical protein